MSEPKKPRRVRFTFVKPEDYQIISVNGLYGGVTPRGDLVCHFFYEYVPVPGEQVGDIQEDGSIKLPVETPEEVKAIRELRVGITINLEQAESVARWMLENIEKYKAAKPKP